jgi:hypothetical protein
MIGRNGFIRNMRGMGSGESMRRMGMSLGGGVTMTGIGRVID